MIHIIQGQHRTHVSRVPIDGASKSTLPKGLPRIYMRLEKNQWYKVTKVFADS